MKKLLIILLALSCNVKEPAQKTETLIKSTPEAEGISSRAILDFIEKAEKEHPEELHSIIVVRHGKIVAEGWWDPYSADSPHLLYSLSKSFTSTAVGLAVKEGLISIYDPVISFFPDKSPENPSQNLSAMRIKDLLRMTTGHATDSYRRIMDHPDGWVSGFLSLPVEHKPGSIFIYNTGATYMLSAILQKVTGQTLTDFLQSRLFDPLEIKKPFWHSDPEGINQGGTGLYVTTLDIAKLGQLYLQKGLWKGKQILTEDWVEQATSLQTSNGSNPESDWDQGYGYQFWRCRHNLYRGDGAYGQYCIVMPEQDAVVAITSGSSDMQGIMNLVWDHLLPAMKDQPLPVDEEVLASLRSRLETLSLTPVQGEETQPIARTISGKKYIMGNNPQGIQAFALNVDQDEKSATFWTDKGEQSFPIGYQKMLKGTFEITGMGKVKTACSGAWVSNDTYKMITYNYETPTAVTYQIKFDGDKITINSKFNVSQGNDQIQMTGRLQR